MKMSEFFGPHEKMPTPRLFFERSEFDARIQRTRQAMASADIDLLIVTDPASMSWLTGYDGWSFYVHQCVLLPMEGEPVWFGREMDAHGALRTCFMKPENITCYPEYYIQTPLHHPMDYLCTQVIKPRRWDRLRIGVEMDNYYFTAAAFEALKHNLPEAVLLDANLFVTWQRAIKSKREIEFMRMAGRIVEKMHATILELIDPDIRKSDLIAEMYKSAISGVDGEGGDYPSMVPFVPTGDESAVPHFTWDNKKFGKDAGTFFEIEGAYRRYHCPTARTYYLGKPPRELVEAEKLTLEGIQAGLEMAKPGNRCEDIANAFLTVLHKGGIEKTSRCGYSIGTTYPPDWGEHTMSLRPGDKNVLKPGMTFHFIPALWMKTWGIEITESLHITETGVETLSKVPRKLFVKD
jgi:ectoine hydrolase